MALNRFDRFQASASTPADPHADGSVNVEAHGPQPSPSFVQRFVQRQGRRIAFGAASLAGGLAIAAATAGTSGIAPLINGGTVANTVYQVVQNQVLGHQAGLDEQVRELQAVNQKAIALGVLSVVPSVKAEYFNHTSSDASMHADLSCSIHLAMDEHGRMVGVSPSFVRVDDALTHEHRDAVMAHESSHCSFAHEVAPFRHSGLSPAAEKFMNDWVVGPSSGGTSLGEVFNETQADTLGLMIMLNEHHFSPQAWAEVERTYHDRTAMQQERERRQQDYNNDPHVTAPAIRMLLEQRATIEKLSPGQYRDVAFGLASRSLLEVLDARRVRATPTHAPVPLLSPNDSWQHGQTYEGSTGFQDLANLGGVTSLREAVVSQALQLREEQLGLRVHLPGIEHTLPRRLAEAWVAQDHPFAGNAVTFVQKADGSIERTWASDEIMGRFYDDNGPSQLRTRESVKAMRASMGWDGVQAELRTALHADEASLANLEKTSPRFNVPAATPPLRPNLPSLSGLGARLDAQARAAEAAMAPVIATVRRALTP